MAAKQVGFRTCPGYGEYKPKLNYSLHSMKK